MKNNNINNYYPIIFEQLYDEFKSTTQLTQYKKEIIKL